MYKYEYIGMPGKVESYRVPLLLWALTESGIKGVILFKGQPMLVDDKKVLWKIQYDLPVQNKEGTIEVLSYEYC